MEWTALPVALRQAFPDHEFYAVPTEGEINSSPGRFPLDGFTSTLLAAAHEANPPEAARDLVSRAAREALPDRSRSAADLVIVLDDLELVNAHQPERVTKVFRRAVRAHLADLPARHSTHDSTAQALRDRVSFHLVVPMIEAWLFGDPRALLAAGVPEPASVVVEPDLEAFETTDPRYIAATDAECPRIPPARAKKYRPKWLGNPERHRHPKGYVQWLCRDGNAKNCTTYSESASGSKALQQLAWHMVLARPGSPARYLRALLADLELVLGVSAFGAVREDPPFAVTSLTQRPAANVLRNL
jgi:hypothetical protein